MVLTDNIQNTVWLSSYHVAKQLYFNIFLAGMMVVE